MTFNYAALQARADRLLRRVGARPAVLRRSSGDRAVLMAFGDPTPQERAGGLWQSTDRHAYISALDLTTAPDIERDKLVVDGVTWNLVAPPGKFEPAGTVVFWDLQVRK